MERVLITGASGYLGQWACRSLASTWRLRGYARSDRPASIPEDVEWIRGDLTTGENLDAAVRDCDRVLHLACLPFGPSGKDPVQAELVNSLGTLRLTEALRRAGRPVHLVYTSTAYAYGSLAKAPSREDQIPCPDSAYGASKLAGELWCDAHVRAHGGTNCTLRIFNVYGRAADATPRPTVETIFLRELAAGRRPVVRGNPESARDFIHVTDVMVAIGKAVAGATGLYNVGTGITSTLPELARMAAKTLGVAIEPEVVVSSESPSRLWADTTRATAGLGFSASISLARGLEVLIDT